ncbi:uncharacterized protein C2orf72 homolog [Lithobates pipiens]
MARDSTESRFLEVLHRFGGPQRVQLVGELWDRAESRALLEVFLREIFPAELPLGADLLRSKAAEHGGEKGPRCEGNPEHGGNGTGPQCEENLQHGGNGTGPRCEENLQRGAQEHEAQPAVPTRPAPQPKPERTLRFGLVFFLCRAESLALRGASRQLREILRDVRERMPAGGAVIGVIMKARSEVNGQEMGVICEDGDGVSALLAILQTVFPAKSRGKLCSEVRACVLLPGQEETRRAIQRLACEALTAADELRKVKPKTKSQCFFWRRRRRWKDCVEKEFIQEGTALTVLQYPNGDCTETTEA